MFTVSTGVYTSIPSDSHSNRRRWGLDDFLVCGVNSTEACLRNFERSRWTKSWPSCWRWCDRSARLRSYLGLVVHSIINQLTNNWCQWKWWQTLADCFEIWTWRGKTLWCSGTSFRSHLTFPGNLAELKHRIRSVGQILQAQSDEFPDPNFSPSDWAIVGQKRVWAVITFFLLNQTLHVSWCGSFVFSCQSFRCRSLPLFICWRFDVSRARDHTYDLCSSRIAFTPFLLFPLSLLVLYVCSVPRPMSQRISTSSLVQRWLPYCLAHWCFAMSLQNKWNCWYSALCM